MTGEALGNVLILNVGQFALVLVPSGSEALDQVVEGGTWSEG